MDPMIKSSVPSGLQSYLESNLSIFLSPAFHFGFIMFLYRTWKCINGHLRHHEFTYLLKTINDPFSTKVK